MRADERVRDAVETIVRCWDEWEAIASQDAQQAQDPQAWIDEMHGQVEAVVGGLVDELMQKERRHLAGLAMQGLLAAGSLREAASLASVVMPCGTLEEGQKIVNVALTGIAFQATTAADALIAALAKPNPKGGA